MVSSAKKYLTQNLEIYDLIQFVNSMLLNYPYDSYSMSQTIKSILKYVIRFFSIRLFRVLVSSPNNFILHISL